MNQRLKSLSSKDVEGILRKRGFTFLRQKGSHRQYVGFVGGRKQQVTVITGQKRFALGTLKSMIDQSGLSEQEWADSL